MLTAKQFRRLPAAQRGHGPFVGPLGLTAKQAAILEFIAHHVVTYQRTPTVREVSAFIGSSCPQAAWGHLKALAKKGAIEWDRKAKDPAGRHPRWPGLSDAIRPAVLATLNQLLGKEQS